MTVYYNEIDPYCAQWLRNLIARNLIPAGDVDERDIRDIHPYDLCDYTSCHFFAGIGGWAYALQLAGWPENRPVWTGSCPCQPFSQAGKRTGTADERHLWPAWFHLIRVCRPQAIFSEQVASKDGLAWLDLVHADLEGAGYAVGAVDLPACSVGAPQIRQRIWVVADANAGRWSQSQIQTGRACPRVSSGSGNMGLPDSTGCQPGNETPETLGHGDSSQSAGRFWSDCEWLPCRDGKARPVKSSFLVLANGIWCGLDSVRAGLITQAREEVISYAKNALADPGEILSLVQKAIGTEEIQRAIGMYGEFPKEKVLLSFLRDIVSTFNESSNYCCVTQANGQDEEGHVRSVRIEDIDLGPSCQRQANGQFRTEFADPLFALSFILACHVATFEKIAGTARSHILSPLIKNETARVGKLRAAGNAIVPQVAAEFIKTFLGGTSGES